ncbi:hypothetical protein [Pseudomonas sp. PDM22]|uniref:hypothetical protein n=1 Tax=Pseudomonas sp. PDM22 TaxID=2769287 RepID=UPI0009DA6364|nr:hypothetical protein [Pseudomonas sp. PDM22]MBD9516896.1 hypothetical protein [Pseudomonas sp. PDM22]OQR28632.1 hypothetical protein BWR15_28825 [Pseudomonas sp. T]
MLPPFPTGSPLPIALVVSLSTMLPPAANAEEDFPPAVYPTLPSSANSAQDFVPSGWQIEKQASGDLNGDHRSDLVLVLHQNTTANFIDNNGDGGNPLNTNPRMLVIAFANTKGGYDLVAENHSLIERHLDRYAQDSFGEVSVDRGTLAVSLYYRSGRWDTTDTYTFRWQNMQFGLIGYDHIQSNGYKPVLNSGISINYSTAKANTWATLGNGPEQTAWLKLPKLPAWTLDNMGEATHFDPLSQDAPQ